MIPSLYDKLGTTKLGDLNTCIECLVEEERNGMFELSLTYPISDALFSSLEEDNIIIANANDTLLNQKFRIYNTRKMMSNRVAVFARHISFDLVNDVVDNIDITNQSCEYALNTIFRSSQFSQHYRGFSDVVNAQNYKISMCNCLEAIAGKEGSIIDTYGTGAEILRDNTNIYVKNRRGNDNLVTIEYAKNLTGFELEEDTTDLITRIIPYAKYTDSGTNQEVLVKGNAVDSTYINNYSHPHIRYIDYSDKFEENETPTVLKLETFARNDYRDNKVDIPKQNYKIEFIPLSKCVGYEGLQDKISLCDTVTVIDTRYSINTKAKVIKTKFNVIKNRYESMELGEPRTTLGDIIGGSGQDGKPGPPGPPGPPGADGNIGDFPNTLPAIPVLSHKLYGFSTIELSWTFENKIYYTYELYASKTKDFVPNTFDLVHAGQTSSFLFQAEPNETWYFRVCCLNSHGNRTAFSSQITVTTKKIDDLGNYVSNMAIGDALIGQLSLDRGWVGKLNANYLDVKGNFSVTDGNGKRTLDIDSFGNVNLDVASMKIKGENAASKADIQLTADNLTLKFTDIGNYNMLYNGDFRNGFSCWDNGGFSIGNHWMGVDAFTYGSIGATKYLRQTIKINNTLRDMTLSCYMYISSGTDGTTNPFYHFYAEVRYTDGTIGYYNKTVVSFDTWEHVTIPIHNITKPIESVVLYGYCRDTTRTAYYTKFMVQTGKTATAFSLNPNETFSEIIKVDKNGLNAIHENGSRTNLNSRALDFYDSNGIRYSQVKDGRLFFTKPDGTTVGFAGRTHFVNDTSTYLSVLNANYGALVGLGAQYSSGGNYTTPLIVSSFNYQEPNGYYYKQGINMMGTTHMRGANLDFYHAGTSDVARSGRIYGSSNNHMVFQGNWGLDFAVEQDGVGWNIVKITADYGTTHKAVLDVYTNLNMNGWTIQNSRSINTLESNSVYSRLNTKDIKDSYGVMSLTDGDIRYTDRQTYTVTKTLDGKLECYVELPYYLAENLENAYHVNISKRGFGDYYIKEVNPYYFILEADREGFVFTFEVVGKLIDKPSNNVVIANRSVIENEEPENSAPAIFDKNEYWRLYKC